MQVKREMRARAMRAAGMVATGMLALVLGLAGTEIAGESECAEGGLPVIGAQRSNGSSLGVEQTSGGAGTEFGSGFASAARDPSARGVASAVLVGDGDALLTSLGCTMLSPAQVLQAEVAGLLPRGFRAETFELSAYDRVMVDPTASVVGFSREGAAEVVFADLASQLMASGWRYEDSGLGTGGSFSKGSGVLTWLFIMCYQVGDETVAVLQYR